MSADRPDETETERADRNFGDILQELRVAQTGVQILFAFLLTIPLQARFTTLDEYHKDVFVTALVCASLATACIIAPVAYHRVMFRKHMKTSVVNAAARLAVAGLLFLGLAIVASVYLVLDLVLGRSPATVMAAVLAAVLVTLWLVMPYLALLQRRRDDAADA
jgi:O-antigen/teichoic acid export membrane protein